jgi:hypothetical protein
MMDVENKNIGVATGLARPKYDIVVQRSRLVIYILVVLMWVLGSPAHAYLGPGAGLGMMGSLIALIIAVLVIILGLIIYPIRRFLKRKSKIDQ